MSRLALRRTASIAAIILYLVAFLTLNTPWILATFAGIAVLEFIIQRSTEIGWRIFRFDLDERQEALQNKILATSYRAAVVIALLFLVLVALVSGGFSAPTMVHQPGSLALRGGALLLIALFLLPGHVSAWMEPAGAEERVVGVGE